MFDRREIFPEPEIPDFHGLVADAQKMACDWYVGPCEFLRYHDVDCEAEYKRRMMAKGLVMQHAHMGFRDKAKSELAFRSIHERTAALGVQVHRYGLCLDWSMGFEASRRKDQLRGTGLILDSVEDFVALTNLAPVAAHFGDFMLGFPAALENTKYALAAGATIIGNLGQYFTFRLPEWNDDIAATSATLSAIALMAAQPVDVLVHSNLDDGFAAVFDDLACALGAAMLERYVVEDLLGGKVTHCFGHHYHDPISRFAFQKALAKVSAHPGSMIYGNTVSYQGGDAQNYASMAGYLLVDVIGQYQMPSGHAVNPVPVTENTRIPDIDEIIEAQLAGARLAEVGKTFTPLFDMSEVVLREKALLQGAEQFCQRVINGFESAGIDIRNPFEMLLAIRRIGGKRLEKWCGPGIWNETTKRRNPLVMSDVLKGLEATVQDQLVKLSDHGVEHLQEAELTVVVASTDVHEHGKSVLEGVFRGLGLRVVDGGVSADPANVANQVESHQAHVIALTTYNGVALTYYGRLADELAEKQLNIPVLMGGQLNEIPEDDNDNESLPVDVSDALERKGAVVCREISDALPVLLAVASGEYPSVRPV